MIKDYLSYCYKEMFGEILLPLGFKINGQGFYRVINSEIIQAVKIQKHLLKRSFTINFQFAAFCMGVIDIKLMAKDDMRLGMILYGDDIWWDFDITDNALIKHKVHHVANEFKKILYLFDSIYDTQSYYNNITRIENKIYGSALEIDPSKVFVCLKLRKYDEALMYIDNIERHINHWLMQQLSLCRGTKDDEESRLVQIAQEDFKEFKNLKDAILGNNLCYINNIIEGNEEITKMSCKSLLKIKL